MTDSIPLSGPDLTEQERTAVLNVLEGDRLSLGPELNEFETSFSERIGSEHAVATSSGTAALHLLLVSLLAKSSLSSRQKPEVITTPFSFVASTTTILHAGARPVFVDIQPDTLNLDPERLESAVSENTVGILPVHIFGTPADMEQINEFASHHGLFVIEDACEALQATYHGENAGTLSDAGTFAFYPNKQMTTGEGGMIVTDRSDLARMCRSLRNQGRAPDSDWLKHEFAGFNYRMTEMQAALGRVQLNRLDELLARREKVAEMYTERLQDVSGVEPLPSFENRTRSWFVYVVRLNESANRKSVRNILSRKGIQTGVYFPCIHKQPFFEKMFPEYDRKFPVAENVSAETLALPFFSKLTEEQVEHVVNALDSAISGSAD